MRPTTLLSGSIVAATLVVASIGVPLRQVSASVAILPTDLVDARQPSLSNSGDWAVFEGTVADGRKSVFRANVGSGEIEELSPVPPPVRPGDTIQPKISADGCVVVAITQIAFDLFRDDDRSDRWDVYRLLVPECGGQVNGWELVSSNTSGTARDGVFTEWAPAISGSGAVVAYVHQSDQSNDPLATISVVDITIPINEPGRVQAVAGVPAEAPNGAFLYKGFTAPELSQNGRHLAFVADATASALLPGWGSGLTPGGPATTQVYVWDRVYGDQRNAVRLVSGVGETASSFGADSPAMSEDGRVIAFRSADRTLLPAVLPSCQMPTSCPTQIYRFDRDTDGNGIFDEVSRRPALALVSAIDAGVVLNGIPTAGDASSWSPSVSADGSQIVFVTDAVNLLPSRRAGGGEETDGDLLIAEFKLGEIRRALDDSALASVPGAHDRPILSKTGQTLLFDTSASAALAAGQAITTAAGRNIVVARYTPQLGLAALDFGSVLLGFESAELYATVQNAGPAAFEPGEVFTTLPNFKVTGGTCTTGVIVAAGDSCKVELTFNPTAPSGFEATLTVRSVGFVPTHISTQLRGAAGDPVLQANPGGVDMESAVVGESGGRVAIGITNNGFLPTRVARIDLGGLHPDDFHVVTESCTGRALNATASCAIEIEFRPGQPGYRSALVRVATGIGEYTSAVVGGYARYAPTFNVASPTANAGEELRVGAYGFPAEVDVTIGFDDGSPAFATVRTSADGGFLAAIAMPVNLRAGERTLVATGPDATVAVATVHVEGSPRTALPHVPGYGMG
ncbi:MAG TPA: choice-of-anchor D domain-containing protein [Ilumatobacter sp.]|nr:choice-of-anchor D domain-containing protein [Ilumatobacter sp.]